MTGVEACFFEGIVREFCGQAKAVDDSLCVNTGVAAATEDFGDDGFAMATIRGEFQHFDNNFVISAGATGAGIAHMNGAAELAAIHLNVALSTGF